MEPGFRRRLEEEFTQEEILDYVRKSVRRLEKLQSDLERSRSQTQRNYIAERIQNRTEALQETMHYLTPRNYRIAFTRILTPDMQTYFMEPTPVQYSASAAPFELSPTTPNIGHLPPLRPFNNNTRRRINANIAARNSPNRIRELAQYIGNLPPLRPFNNNTRRRINANIAARNALTAALPPLIRVTSPNIGNLPPLRPFNTNTRRRINANKANHNY
jgi:hypothetical protein